MSQLVKYDAAIAAIAAAKSVDEVLDIRDKADALRAAAKIANNKQAELDMAEIRLRAERHVGEMMKAELAAGNRQPQGGDKKSKVSKKPLISLDDVGIDKNLANRARKLAEPTKNEFEQQVKQWRNNIEQSGDRVTLKLISPKRKKKKKDDGDLFSQWYHKAVKGMANVERFFGILDKCERTEGHKVAVQGMLQSMKELGEDGSRWLSGGKALQREIKTKLKLVK
jgi:hypothetical protein